MINPDGRKYKRIFIQALQPFMDFLENQRKEMTVGNWMEAVQRVQLRIVFSPEQYLGKDLPSPELVKKIVNEIFDDFISENVSEPFDTINTY